MTRVEPDAALSVSALNRLVRDALEGAIGQVWVRGEVSNVRRQSSGHWYFTLKDAESQVAAAMFRGVAERSPHLPKEGDEVVVLGDLAVYTPRGTYQVLVRRLLPAGRGDLRARFDALKRKLAAEGLMDPARKRPLPAVPARVVILTSPTGAALRDMLQILARRAPQLSVFVFPVRVQGTGAAEEIAAALGHIAAWSARGAFRADAVVLARGGGSIEDLWPFNEEPVARAIAACPVPTICGVGHEIDHTIADFVADLRAPTPSAAAELLIPDRADLRARAAAQVARIARAAGATLAAQGRDLRRLAASAVFREPARVVALFWQRLDLVADALAREPRRAAAAARVRWAAAAGRLLRAPGALVRAKARALEVAAAHLGRHAPDARIRLERARLRGLAARLDLLNPARTLARGYAVVRDARGRIARSVAQLPPGSAFTAELADGRVRAKVETIP